MPGFPHSNVEIQNHCKVVTRLELRFKCLDHAEATLLLTIVESEYIQLVNFTRLVKFQRRCEMMVELNR